MFCSFTRNSRILRLFGTGRVVRPDDTEFDSLRTHFGPMHPGLRAAIVIDVERIADACGYAVPYYELVDERPVLDKHHAKATEEAYSGAIARNRQSIDGLPALDPDHPPPVTLALHSAPDVTPAWRWAHGARHPVGEQTQNRPNSSVALSPFCAARA